MCEQMTKEIKYKMYDNVVSTVMMNVIVEKQRCGKFLIYDFDQTDDGNRLYFNVMSVAADLEKEKIYLDMPLLDFIFFWKKEGKIVRICDGLVHFRKENYQMKTKQVHLL